MVIDLHIALEAVESYFNDDTKANVTLGHMAGTQLFKHIFDLSLGYFRFNDILLIEGCQDYIGMSAPSPVNNHFYYAGLMTKQPTHSLFNQFDDPFSFKILNDGNPVTEYNCKMDIQRINAFKLVIVADAHLIPPKLLNEIKRYVTGKLIILVDPYTVYGLAYTQVPTVIYSCFECDPLTALARKVYGVETDKVKQSKTRMIDYSRGTGPKTMTKMTDNQYCTNDMSYLEYMMDKQVSMGIRKTHKVMVDSNQVMTYKMDEGDIDNVTINEHSLITIENLPGALHSTHACKLNGFKDKFHAHLEFTEKLNPFNKDNTIVRVKPANIMKISDIGFHRFNNLTFIQSTCSRKLTNAELYTLMISTEHLTIVED